MNFQALQLLKQAETFIDSQSWKFYMSSGKHTPIFIKKKKKKKKKKNKYFCHILRLKRSKIASKCTLWSTNTCTGFHFTYSEYRKWIKRLLHSMWGSTFKVVSVRATKSTFQRVRRQCFFFSKSWGHFTKERDRFLIFNRKTYKNDTLTTSKHRLCCEVSFKVPLPHPRIPSLTDFSWCAQKWTSFSFSKHFLHKFLSK